MSGDASTPDDAMRWRTVQAWWDKPELFHEWCAYVEDLLYRGVLCWQPFPPGASEDDRRAAQVAMAALRYLRAPVEEARVIVRRPAWKDEEAKWIAEVEQRDDEPGSSSGTGGRGR